MTSCAETSNRPQAASEDFGMSLREPIAIVGIGVRFPGKVTGAESFWRLLCEGADATSEVPATRWHWESVYNPEPGTPGKLYTRRGGFLENIELFDAPFFGISPREAAKADPQQRILLEVAYEALEDAGLPLERLKGSRTGVFVGICTYDYGLIQGQNHFRQGIDAYSPLGSAMCLSANRLSYFFDLKGPSLAVDTACSSSLVAAHLACQAMWNGEATAALVGGVNVTLQPGGTIGFCQAKMLAPDGYCKSFAADADGYVRAEGAGVVVLKTLSRALADQDRIYATIRATCVNHDGRTGGISVPSEHAQAEMLRDVYHQAAIEPEQVQFIEAHGTGTPVGDPIELRAIGRALAGSRQLGAECIIGSVKSNIGHLEGASGIAGLIKAALSVHHGQIPPNLHFDAPNSQIPFNELRLRVAEKLEPWPENGGSVRVAGVNSFGFGGTNAHVVVASADETASRTPESDWHEGRALLIPLSARSPEALKSLAERYAVEIADRNLDLADVAHSTAHRRTHHDCRTAFVAHNRAEFLDRVSAFAEDGTIVDSLPLNERTLVFVFSGMGPQWWAMGRQLRNEEPVFRRAVEECDVALRRFVDWSLLDELSKDESTSRINETWIAQPAIFAVQVALARLWESWGIRADLTYGHSLGEVAAAHYAGVLDLEVAVSLVYHRSRLQHQASGEGRMLAVAMPISEAESVVSEYDGAVSIAAYNSPESVTLSGDAEFLQRISDHLTSSEVFNRFLKVDVPYHSRAMDRLRAELLDSLTTLSPGEARVPLVSTVTGRRISGEEMDAEYWWQGMRQPVRFLEATETVAQEGHRTFLEISPHPVLSTSISECVSKFGRDAVLLPSLRRDERERATMLDSVGRLYARGFSVDWTPVNGDVGRSVPLPSYPWQHEAYWNEPERARQERVGERVHPLLGLPSETARMTWTADLDYYPLAYLDDHRVHQHVIFPGAGYVEMAIAAAHQIHGEKPCVLEDLAIHKAMLLPSGARPSVQLAIGERGSEFEIFSRAPGAESPWERQVSGKLFPLPDGEEPEPFAIEDIKRRSTGEVSRDECYRALDARGLHYGPGFRGITRLWTGHREALAEIEFSSEVLPDINRYYSHPGVLDSAFQVLMGAMWGEAESGGLGEGLFLPVRINQTISRQRLPLKLWAFARIVRRQGRRITGDVFILDETGRPLMETRGLIAQYVERRDVAAVGLYAYEWKTKDPENAGPRNAGDLPSPRKIRSNLLALGDKAPWRVDRNAVARGPEVLQLAEAYVFEALDRLGWRPKVGDRLSVEALAKQLGVVEEHRRFFGRLVSSLADSGYLQRDGDVWRVAKAFSKTKAHAVWTTIWERYPAALAELLLTLRCGEKLADVLLGQVDPLEVMFPGGSFAVAEHLYQDAPAFSNCNRIVQKAVAAVAAGAPPDRTIRILEIGGGTGGLTAYVLPELSGANCEYVFTDVAPHLLSQAELRFGSYRSVEFKVLDIEKDPAAQGFDLHTFDLILASDVLHATADLRHTLEQCRRLLASEGLLLLLEGTWVPTPLWCTLVFGMLKGWWLFTDVELRGEDPWLSARRWCDLLTSSGFGDVVDLTDELDADQCINSVIVARGPAIAMTTADPEPTGLQESDPKGGTWLIMADRTGIGADLARRLGSLGYDTVTVQTGESFEASCNGTFTVDPLVKEQMRSLLAEVLQRPTPLRGVVHLGWLKLRAAQDTTLDTFRAERAAVCASALHFVQLLAEIDPVPPPRIFFVTRGAVRIVASQDEVAVEQAPLWGLARVVMTEFPQFQARLIDLEPGCKDAEPLFKEILNNDVEDEVALRRSTRYVHRFTRVTPSSFHAAPASDPGTPFAIELPASGGLDDLVIQEATRVAPGSGEIEIEIHASGLNFKDVMLAMDMLPEDATEGGYTGRVLGIECAGRISAIGEGVSGLSVDDRVLACGPGTLRSYLTLDARIVAPIPQHLSYEEAATITIAFQTAYYSLHTIARLQRGERVLIHAATGGVGLAALQVAKWLGAEIFATAGTDEKRQLLRVLGVENVMNSRDLSFADEVMRRTGGEGVDVVLNSLAGDAIPKSLALLRPFGRFVEIGKRDVYEDSKIGLRPLRINLSMYVVDMDRFCAERPLRAKELFEEIMHLVANKTFKPLPYRTFSVARTAVAIRHMAQGKHIGKVVISISDAPSDIVAPPKPKQRFCGDATYLVTGGLGGFGLALAQWLARNGAGHIALMSRRSQVPAEAKPAFAAMEADGARVTLMPGDVSLEEDVSRVLNAIEETGPPLKGIFHAAMVIDDCPLAMLTPERFAAVVEPKADGAWNLHRHTLQLPLDHFVLFSSLAAIVGSPGQANYAAANTVLDALAHHRRNQGLPALTVNWGAISDVGYVAHNRLIADRLESLGLKALPVEQMLKVLGKLLACDADQVTAVRVDWPKLSRKINLTRSPRFADLVAEQGGHEVGGTGASDLDAILSAEPSKRIEILLSRLREQLGKVLETSAGRLDIKQPLLSLGVDSLMAVELRNRIKTDLAVDVPLTKFVEGISLRGIAEYVLERVEAQHLPGTEQARTVTARRAGVVRSASAKPAEDGTPLETVDNFSDEEVNAELRRLLSETSDG